MSKKEKMDQVNNSSLGSIRSIIDSNMPLDNKQIMVDSAFDVAESIGCKDALVICLDEISKSLKKLKKNCNNKKDADQLTAVIVAIISSEMPLGLIQYSCDSLSKLVKSMIFSQIEEANIDCVEAFKEMLEGNTNSNE